MTAASRERAPVRTLTAVRAMAAVAGIPPKSGLARLARPCPNSSRSGSWRSETLIASATVADSRLSSAASAATASAGIARTRRSFQARAGSCGAGRPSGSAPIRAMSRSATWASTVAAATATSDIGMPGRQREETSMAAATAAAMAGAAQAGLAAQAVIASAATATTFSPSAGTPSAVGICCTAMITAMPRVKPSMTGSGTKRT